MLQFFCFIKLHRQQFVVLLATLCRSDDELWPSRMIWGIWLLSVMSRIPEYKYQESFHILISLQINAFQVMDHIICIMNCRTTITTSLWALLIKGANIRIRCRRLLTSPVFIFHTHVRYRSTYYTYATFSSSGGVRQIINGIYFHDDQNLHWKFVCGWKCTVLPALSVWDSSQKNIFSALIRLQILNVSKRQPNWSPPVNGQELSVRPINIAASKDVDVSEPQSQSEMPNYAESSQSKELAVSWL